MEPDWAQQISKKAWTEQIEKKYPSQDPDGNDSYYCYHCDVHCEHPCYWPEWLERWLQNSGIFLKKLRKYTELKQM